MDEIERILNTDSSLFNHMYHNILEIIRKFYHKKIGISKIPTSKVLKIYLDSLYRESIYKENPEEIFIKMYYNLIIDKDNSNINKLNNLKEFYNYCIKDIKLDNNYRISIKSRINKERR